MGACSSKKKTKKTVKCLTAQVRLLEEEIVQIMHEREKEARVFEKPVIEFTFEEAEWKGEKKKLKGEVKRLKKAVEEKERKIMELEENCGLNGGKCVLLCDKGWPLLGSSCGGYSSTINMVVTQPREESVRRDEAVDKWKQLYLAIKTELEDLIQTTHGDAIYWRAEEEEMVEELKREVKSKEETIQALEVRLAAMERQEYERKREIDILRQSLRIMSSISSKNTNKKTSRLSKSLNQYF